MTDNRTTETQEERNERLLRECVRLKREKNEAKAALRGAHGMLSCYEDGFNELSELFEEMLTATDACIRGIATLTRDDWYIWQERYEKIGECW